MIDDARFNRAIELIDAANARDPNRVTVGGVERAKEVVYAERMTDALARFAPDASDALKLAARAQHIRRWTHPRERYPMDRKGYHLWRTGLYGYHADEAEKILRQVGYDEATIGRVRDLVSKKRLNPRKPDTDADAQTLEDVVCLVFLEHEFDAFAAKHDDAKLVTIIRRTWKKMSDRAHAAAMELPLSDNAKRLIAMALSDA